MSAPSSTSDASGSPAPASTDGLSASANTGDPAAAQVGGLSAAGQRVVWGAVSAIGVLLAAVVALAAISLVGWAVDHPENAGATSAMQVGLQAWYLAHGVALPVSWGTLSVPPLLASFAIALFFYRSARSTARSLEIRRPLEVAETVAAYAITYVTLAVVLTSLAYPDGGIGIAQTAWAALAFAVIPTTAGMLIETGLGSALADAFPGPAYAYGHGLRAGLIGATGVSALLVAASLIVNFSEASALVAALAPGGIAGLSIFGISLLFLPNAMVLAMTLGTGAGFSVGAQTTVGLGAVDRGSLPAFPLMAAIPHGWSVLVWSAVLVPLAAAVLAGLATVRRIEPEDRTTPALLISSAAIALGSAVAVGALAGFSGGALGDANLASVGTPMLTAAAYQAVLTFVVVAVVVFAGARGQIRSAPAVRREKVVAAAQEADDAGTEAHPDAAAVVAGAARAIREKITVTSKRGLRRLTRSAPAPKAGGATAPSATLSVVQRARAEKSEASGADAEKSEASRADAEKGEASGADDGAPETNASAEDELHAADPEVEDAAEVDGAADEAGETPNVDQRKAG